MFLLCRRRVPPNLHLPVRMLIFCLLKLTHTKGSEDNLMTMMKGGKIRIMPQGSLHATEFSTREVLER